MSLTCLYSNVHAAYACFLWEVDEDSEHGDLINGES